MLKILSKPQTKKVRLYNFVKQRVGGFEFALKNHHTQYQSWLKNLSPGKLYEKEAWI